MIRFFKRKQSLEKVEHELASRMPITYQILDSAADKVFQARDNGEITQEEAEKELDEIWL